MISTNQEITGVRAASITLSNAENITVKKAVISQLNVNNFDLIFHHSDLVSASLKFQLHLHSFWRKNIQLYIPEMNMEIEGTITNTHNIGSGKFKLNIEFFPEVPQYWRECLFDLWPQN